jgi:hypothetical protein
VFPTGKISIKNKYTGCYESPRNKSNHQ